MSDNREAALQYAGLGWRVFPCHTVQGGRCSCGKPDCPHAGKHPATGSGFKEATTDREQVGGWWSSQPDANIGLATGSASGLFVFDLDGPEAFAELDRLEDQFGKLPETVKARTGKGLHLYFKYDPDRPVKSRTKIGKRPVDVKGDGGYVIAPPSTHRTGVRYEWVNSPAETELAVPPDWLIDYVTGGATPPKVQDAVTQISHDEAFDLQTAPGAPVGQRHDTALKLIGAELARGTDRFEVMTLALRWGERCAEPMEPSELIRIVTDLSNKDARKLEEGITTRRQLA